MPEAKRNAKAKPKSKAKSAKVHSAPLPPKEAFDANERKIDARLQRIVVLQEELEAGRKFVEEWPDREASLVADLSDNNEKVDRYMRARTRLDKALTSVENERLLRDMQAKIERLKREIRYQEDGTKVRKARVHEEPSIW